MVVDFARGARIHVTTLNRDWTENDIQPGSHVSIILYYDLLGTDCTSNVSSGQHYGRPFLKVDLTGRRSGPPL